MEGGREEERRGRERKGRRENKKEKRKGQKKGKEGEKNPRFHGNKLWETVKPSKRLDLPFGCAESS